MDLKCPIILCEGSSDEALFRNLIRARNLGDFDVRSPDPDKGETSGDGSFERRLKGLKVPRDVRARRAVIVVADNDDSPAAKFGEVCKQVRNATGHAPTKPRDFTPTSRELPPVAVLMIPWDDQPGSAETLCYESASVQWSQYVACVDKYITCIKAKARKAQKLSKLQLSTLFGAACEYDPFTSLAMAWTGGRRPHNLVPLDHPCFDRIATFLAAI